MEAGLKTEDPHDSCDWGHTDHLVQESEVPLPLLRADAAPALTSMPPVLGLWKSQISKKKIFFFFLRESTHTCANRGGEGLKEGEGGRES